MRTSTVYFAFVAERSRARIIVAKIPFPFSNTDEIIAPVVACVTPRTRLALLDHVTSQTDIILPIERLVSELSQCGVDTLVDGAHAPGMVPLNLARLGTTYEIPSKEALALENLEPKGYQKTN